MKVSLTPALAKFVDQKVGTGLYQNPSEVVREGLRLLKQREDVEGRTLEALRDDVAAGIAQADRGATRPIDRSTFGRIRASGRKTLRGAPNSPAVQRADKT